MNLRCRILFLHFTMSNKKIATFITNFQLNLSLFVVVVVVVVVVVEGKSDIANEYCIVCVQYSPTHTSVS